jgi:CRP-like cAMP-binding protein
MASVPGLDPATRLLLRPRQLRDLVRGISWLSSLADDEIDALLARSEVSHLNAREWVFRQEAPAYWVYIVISGSVRLTRSAGDRLATIRCVERGGPLGQLSMVASDGVYLYSAEALRKTRLLAIPSAECRAIMDSHLACRADFMSGLALELTERLEDLALLTQADAMARLVNYLVRQLPPGRRKSPRVVRLAIPKRWLAAQLAMTPETLSRLLGKLRDRGAIDIDHQRLEIIDEQMLQNVLLADE